MLLWPKRDVPTAAPSTVTLTPPVTITETAAAPTATTTPADRVAKMVRDSMQRKFDSDAPELGLKVLNVNLVNKAGNEYKGLAELRAGNGEQRKISIEVTADGDSVLWELPPGALAFAIPTSTPAARAFPVPGADQYGFLDGPRCSMFDTAALVIRTMQSGAVICRVDAPGRYTYHGLRLSDGGQITLDALAMEDGFAAVNPVDGTRYEVTRDGLAIYTPDGEVYREPAIAAGP